MGVRACAGGDGQRGAQRPGALQPWVNDLLAALGETLAAHGGTAGILRDHGPAPLNSWPGVDALVISTDNSLT